MDENKKKMTIRKDEAQLILTLIYAALEAPNRLDYHDNASYAIRALRDKMGALFSSEEHRDSKEIDWFLRHKLKTIRAEVEVEVPSMPPLTEDGL